MFNLGEILRYDGEIRRPFGEKLKLGPLGVAGNIRWEEEDDLDMEINENARTDFRAVEAEYNLITMAPSSFPRRISRMMKGRKNEKKRYR